MRLAQKKRRPQNNPGRPVYPLEWFADSFFPKGVIPRNVPATAGILNFCWP